MKKEGGRKGEKMGKRDGSGQRGRKGRREAEKWEVKEEGNGERGREGKTEGRK